MSSCPSFWLRGDPTESLFPDDAGPESTLGVRRHCGLIWLSDGHTSRICPLAGVLLQRASDHLASTDSLLSPWIHGLDQEETGCAPTILLVQPRGEAQVLPAVEARELLRVRNPKPLLQPHE